MSEPWVNSPDACLDEGAASCALWWRTTPPSTAGRIGFVGRFRATDRQAAVRVLDRAAERLADERCRVAIGPVDGSTWASYRLVTDPLGDFASAAPAFALEPNNPPDWPAWWQEASFASHETYRSTVNSAIDEPDDFVESVVARRDFPGVAIRPLDGSALDREIRQVHAVCSAAFAKRYLFQPIGAEAFAAATMPLLQRVTSELVLVAEHERRGIVGFCFMLPVGQLTDTVVLKTLAVMPAVEWSGLGAVLMRSAYANAHELGYRRAISALMHDRNRAARRLYASRMKVIRRYALFARDLTGGTGEAS